MPKGRKRSAVEGRRWLERYEDGQGLEAIAKEAHRSNATVQRGIESARQERDAREVRMATFTDGYRQHIEDLLGLIRDVRQRAATPHAAGLWTGADRRTTLLRDGLDRHLPDAPLWAAIDTWEETAQYLTNLSAQSRLEIEKRVATEIIPAHSHALEEGWNKSLWFAVEQAVAGAPLDNFPYSKERGARGQQLQWASITLSQTVPETESNQLVALQEAHGRLVAKLMPPDAPPAHPLRVAQEQWRDAVEELDTQVELLLLRHVLPGTCAICAPATSPSARGTRRKRSSS